MDICYDNKHFNLFSCRKTDQTPEQKVELVKNSVIEERFFNSNRTSDPTEKALADFIKRKNSKEHFVEQTVKQIGYPRWDKIVITESKNKIAGRGNSDSTFTTYYVPFVRDSQNFVNASMVIKAYPSDTTFSYKCDWQYAEKQNSNSQISDSAEYFAIFFMVLDKKVFGYNKFNIVDTNLFNNGINTPLYVTLDSMFTLERNNLLQPVEYCQSVTITFRVLCSAKSPAKIYSNRGNISFVCFGQIITNYCWVEYIEGGVPGGGSTTTPPNNPCGGTVAARGQLQIGCEPGWNPDPTPISTITYLTDALALSSSQVAFLTQYPSYQVPLYYYISQNYSSQAVQICKDHIDLLIAEPEYVQFVINHDNTGNHSVVWWMDDTWLDNPQYFNLDTFEDYRKLTAAEKALIKLHPTAAFIINQFNRPMAKDYTVQKFGINGLNDKSDAFRHTFFQAINTVRVGAVITKKFADAHESEVPVQLSKEKQMDTLNNNLGIAYGQTQSYPASTPNIIANAIMIKLNNGELLYIKPLDFSTSPIFDANHDGIQDCPTCLNGILNNSVLTPTNQ